MIEGLERCKKIGEFVGVMGVSLGGILGGFKGNFEKIFSVLFCIDFSVSRTNNRIQGDPKNPQKVEVLSTPGADPTLAD